MAVPESLVGREDLENDFGFVATAVSYPEMLSRAGFISIGSQDTTAEYLEVAGRWLTAADDLEHELRTAMGDDVFEDKRASRVASYDMIESGDLERTLFWATA